jgi:imidazole glycerol-phosphate synthase subunit HisH
MPDIIIVDYGMGNLRSVQKKFERINVGCEITEDLTKIKNAKKLILPGVGHFANGVKKLKESGIWDILNHRVIIDKIPILGICLGMQLMANKSEEGDVEGFGWFDANVVRFRVSDKIKFKVPHMGWNNLLITKENPFFIDINPEAQFYFVHSYHWVCNNVEDELASTQYDYKFTSAVARDNIIGVQFHPEKSHEQGEMLLKNFTGFQNVQA